MSTRPSAHTVAEHTAFDHLSAPPIACVCFYLGANLPQCPCDDPGAARSESLDWSQLRPWPYTVGVGHPSTAPGAMCVCCDHGICLWPGTNLGTSHGLGDIHGQPAFVVGHISGMWPYFSVASDGQGACSVNLCSAGARQLFRCGGVEVKANWAPPYAMAHWHVRWDVKCNNTAKRPALCLKLCVGPSAKTPGVRCSIMGQCIWIGRAIPALKHPGRGPWELFE